MDDKKALVDGLSIVERGILYTVDFNNDSVGMTLYSGKDGFKALQVLERLQDMRPSDLKAILLAGKYEESQPRPLSNRAEYQKVLGGFDIAKKVADFMEDCDPALNGSNRASRVGWVNDVLHGRAKETTGDLVISLEKLCKPGHEERQNQIGREILKFSMQQLLIPMRYDAPDVEMRAYQIPVEDVNGRHLKIINQPIYDEAVKNGFPAGFFRDAYFHAVTFYALPERADFSSSTLLDCKFYVCAARGANFHGSSLHSTDFQTVDLSDANFTNATLAHTHFNDADMKGVGFPYARLKNCNLTHCNMWDVSLAETTLHEVRLAKIEEPRIKHFDMAVFNYGAVEPETAKWLSDKMRAELNIKPNGDTPQKNKGKKPDKAAPEPSR